VETTKNGAEGVLLSHGGASGGYSFYVQDGTLHYVHNYVGRILYHLESKQAVPKGRCSLRYEFEVTGKPDIFKGKGAPGLGRLYIDGRLAGQMELPVTTPICWDLASGMSCGADPGSTVTSDYQSPFKFMGKIHSVTVDVSGELIKDHEAEVRIVMARQ
jgi:arylsulfatase